MTTFLGWDCANKSLAWSHVTVDTNIFYKLAVLLPDLVDATAKLCDQCDDNSVELCIGVIGRFRSIMHGFLRYHSADVVDLLCGQKLEDVGEIDRTRALCDFLPSIDIDITTTHVIIERQNNIGKMVNRPSTAVSAQLAFYYTMQGCECSYIDPKLKNQLVLSPGLCVNDFIQRELAKNNKCLTSVKYNARKKHAKASFTYMLDVFGQSHVYERVPKTYHDDLADSTMEIIAYVKKEGLIKYM